ncbi:GGDEF domain-containing phosphodiesterase [Kangiella marina]|uniref:EAL domain-containing protein n=1 Tax=Kangiella marina TaxID=1079178 RepID=A0ABP8IJC4_9GAMM
MEAPKVLDWVERHKIIIRRLMIPLIITLAALVYLLVFFTGGIKYVYSHSMYIPILLASLVFGTKGGIAMAIMAGIILGPFMPIDVVSGEMQETANWLYRMGFFVLIGSLSGFASDCVIKYTKRLHWLSNYNPTTKLPNRHALFKDMERLEKGSKTGDEIILAVVAIDNILELKSVFGFGVIDDATRQMARRLALNGGDDIYHTDSAQVAMVLDKGDITNKRFLDNLSVLLKEAVTYNDISVHIETRVGYVSFNRVEQAPEVYLHRAEAALSLVQEKSVDMTAFNPAMATQKEANISILGELQTAINDEQLLFYYQPKIDLRTGDICSAEALLRWQHPRRGLLTPGSFIARAEQSTLIQTITEFALREAIKQHKVWSMQGVEIPISVNISTRNLLHPQFPQIAMRLLREYKVDGKWIELEVTEGALVVDMEQAIDTLMQLAEANFSISIDDFGTGYSSLQYLHRLPASLIKIDQSFIKRLPHDKGAVYIVDAAVTLAQKMGVKTIAEGVETLEVYDYLRQTDCDMAQGYFISKPIPQDRFSRWFLNQNGTYASLG